MSLLLADALLVLSLLFVRPAPDHAWRLRLVAHALLLSASLLVAALAGPHRLLPLLGLAAALLQAGLAWQFRPAAPAQALPVGPPVVVWLLAGLVVVGLSLRLLPDGTLPPGPAGLLSAALAILLTGLLGAAASARTSGRGTSGGTTAALASLLLAGDGMLLVACQLPGMAVSSLGCLLLLQAGLLRCLLRTWVVPADTPRTASP
ncbi:hypothetical protein [Lichenicola sp.]|uniref:hypothetical protein n=1 Tax=Lichenicola sp. TaxID=2804529 RepID=UPI003AFFD57C